jgi:2-polyprenyl-3-methyl-5-hydroxy-6-metoxy-1,4-benzoquinol methylase
MSTVPVATPLDERVFQATLGALELYGIYIGDRLGLYRALRETEDLSVPELAARCQIHPRYAQEWLEQQAVAGVLEVDDPATAADTRRYSLPEAHAVVLLDETDASYVVPFGHMLVGIANVLDEVVAAYRTGEGVPYSRYGADFRYGQGAINRPAFTSALVEEWLPALSVADRLERGARLVDVGCGQGFATIAAARAFPAVEAWGIDNDPASIEDAREHAAVAGVPARFECADAASLALLGPFDVVLVLEVLHDLARPVEVLDTARRALADGGAILVADEAVAAKFVAPGDDLERMMYGWSITHCLPAAMTERPSAAIGTVIREDTVRDLARQAGLESVDVLDVDGGFFRLYELRP